MNKTHTDATDDLLYEALHHDTDLEDIIGLEENEPIAGGNTWLVLIHEEPNAAGEHTAEFVREFDNGASDRAFEYAANTNELLAGNDDVRISVRRVTPAENHDRMNEGEDR